MMGYMIGRIVGIIIFPLLLMALIGGMYWLLKRGRISFRQAMFSRWVVISSLVLTGLGLLGQAVKHLSS